MDVRGYSDPEKSLTQLKRFRLAPINKENPLLEKELLYMVKQRLLKMGYIQDDDSPEFLVAMNSYSGPFQYYVPPTTLYLPQYVPGSTKTYSGNIGGMSYYGTERTDSKVESKPYTVGGYTETAYYRNIQLYFVDYSKLIQSETVDLLWLGQVESSGSTSDIRIVAPYFLDELLSEFPKATGKLNKRTVDWPGH